jgi:hypothetical protein
MSILRKWSRWLWVQAFFSPIVFPGIWGIPAVTMRVGSPAVWVSTVVIIRFRFMGGGFLSQMGDGAAQAALTNGGAAAKQSPQPSLG